MIGEEVDLKIEKISQANFGSNPTVIRMNDSTWENPKHAKQWIQTLETYAHPELGNMGVDVIDSADVLRVVSPIWTDKHKMARRVMQRIGTVLDVAKAKKMRAGENPVLEIKSLNVLAKIKPSDNHHDAMAWQDLPAFYQELSSRDAMAALALRFLIMTATRTSETLGATWREIGDDVWTIPAERMKNGLLSPVNFEAKFKLQGV